MVAEKGIPADLHHQIMVHHKSKYSSKIKNKLKSLKIKAAVAKARPAKSVPKHQKVDVSHAKGQHQEVQACPDLLPNCPTIARNKWCEKRYSKWWRTNQQKCPNSCKTGKICEIKAKVMDSANADA